MNSTYLWGVAILVALLLSPAIIAGAGFAVAILLAVLAVAILIGGPKLWELHMNRNLGAKSGARARDLINGDQKRGDDK